MSSNKRSTRWVDMKETDQAHLHEKVRALLKESLDLLGKAILVTPTGERRNLYTEAQIHMTIAEDILGDNRHTKWPTLTG